MTGLHLLKSHGNTKNEIKSDNFKISKEIKNFQDDGKNTTGAGMAKAMGKVFLQLSEYVEKIKPDIILSGFDIGANFVLTVVGAHLNIPVAHIQGGEVTGSIDESLRHAMSKFSNYHYVANNDAKKRLKDNKPVVVIMKTIMGKGVDFMENSHKWHGIAPDDDQLKKALSQLDETLGDY